MSRRRIHHPDSPRWHGHPRKYQREAQERFAFERQRVVLPWSWVTTRCDVNMCLDVDCMTLHESEAIQYPKGVCVYCGDPAGTRDHLLPRPMTGVTLRARVLTVPACSDCNARINDHPSACITERRDRAHASIRRTNKTLLARPIKRGWDLRELGPTLRSVAEKNNRKTEWLLARLAWPDDPYYDLRAFQRSGIADPVAAGLIRGVDAA